LRFVAAAALSAVGTLQSYGINIVWDFSYDVHEFWTPEKRQVLDLVAQQFNGYILNTPDYSIYSDDVMNFTISFTDPGTGSLESIPYFPAGNQTLIIFAGARPLEGSLLGLGGPVNYGFGYSSPRGETFADLMYEADNEETFQPFAGTISLKLEADYYFGLEDAVPVGKIDLFTLALHEVAHVLGIGTSDAWKARVDENGYYKGEHVVEIVGPDGLPTTPAHLDGPYVMNATLTSGTRIYLSDIEYAMLEDLGYLAIPEPATTSFVLLAGAAAITASRRRKAS